MSPLLAPRAAGRIWTAASAHAAVGHSCRRRTAAAKSGHVEEGEPRRGRATRGSHRQPPPCAWISPEKGRQRGPCRARISPAVAASSRADLADRRLLARDIDLAGRHLVPTMGRAPLLGSVISLGLLMGAPLGVGGAPGGEGREGEGRGGEGWDVGIGEGRWAWSESDHEMGGLRREARLGSGNKTLSLVYIQLADNGLRWAAYWAIIYRGGPYSVTAPVNRFCEAVG